MRLMLMVGISVLAASELAQADGPIPQDSVKIEKRLRDRADWYRQTGPGAYDKFGTKDPRWDAPARESIDLAARLNDPRTSPQIRVEDINKKAKLAIDAGCDDPLVAYMYVRTSVGKTVPGAEEFAQRLQAAALALANSRYPAFRRAGAFEAAATSIVNSKEPTDAAKISAAQNFDAAMNLLPESVATDERTEFWEDVWFDIIKRLFFGHRALGMDEVVSYKRIDAALGKIPELEVFRLQVRGVFWYSYGWEARTKALAPQVPEGGFEIFKNRLKESQKAFNEAWKLRPDARTAEYLLEIEKAIGTDRAVMELWFDRAITANGDSRSACFTKLDWLDPKWHGTSAEMLAFGHACAETKNWRTGITLLAGDAHLRHYITLQPVDRFTYFSKPEIWSEVQSTYDDYLKHFPADNVARSKYAVLCYFAAHYHDSTDQFKILGDQLAEWPETTRMPMATMKQIRSMATARGTNIPRPGNAPAAKNNKPARP
jgi:hypothetical protein